MEEVVVTAPRVDDDYFDGAVTATFNAGFGLGFSGRVIISDDGLSGYVGMGMRVGFGFGASLTGGVRESNSDGAGIATSVSITAGAGSGFSGNLTSGINGVSGFGGIGVGLGFGATSTIGIGGSIITWPSASQ